MAGIMMSAFFVLCTSLSAQTLTPENQVIALRHIIEQTDDLGQKEAALTLMAQAGTYQALTYAATMMAIIVLLHRLLIITFGHDRRQLKQVSNHHQLHPSKRLVFAVFIAP